jgi:hypothetical protein
MRRHLATVLLPMAVAAQAQVPPPPQLEPLPEVPERPAAGQGAAEEPAVRIPAGKDDKVEHFNYGGRMMVRVTPPGGRAYYLIEGPGGWLRRDSLDDGTRVPMWPLHTFD